LFTENQKEGLVGRGKLLHTSLQGTKKNQKNLFELNEQPSREKDQGKKRPT